MSNPLVRVGLGTRVMYDGAIAEVVELSPTATGTHVVLKVAGRQLVRITLRALLDTDGVRILGDRADSTPGEPPDPATIVLASLEEPERSMIRDRARPREGDPHRLSRRRQLLAAANEPRPQYEPQLSLTSRYEAKAAELGVSLRTIAQWVADFRAGGEAGLAPKRDGQQQTRSTDTDERWVETALEVMVEHTDQSRPSQTMVINRTNARTVARFGEGVVRPPSRATAFRVLAELERRRPTFRLSTKRNRDIAGRPTEAHGKLRPTRPGEYLLMDTTRLDVFALGLSFLLPRAIGSSRAFEMMLSGRDVTAHEAAAIGLVSRVVPDDELLTEALDLADQINGWSTQGTALTKRTMWAGLEMGTLRGAIEMETNTQLFIRLTTDNFQEAVRARKEGRRPDFKD